MPAASRRPRVLPAVLWIATLGNCAGGTSDRSAGGSGTDDPGPIVEPSAESRGDPGSAELVAPVPAGPSRPLPVDPAAPGGVPAEDVLGVDVPIEDPGGSALVAFHEALRRVAREGGQTRLVFYGGSHVASDVFTGEIRQRLQLAFGDAGHGFVMPVRPWPSYDPRGVDVERDRINLRRWETTHVTVGQNRPGAYGLAGVYVESSRSDAYGLLTTATQGLVGRTASGMEIWFWSQPGGGAFDVLVDGQPHSSVDTEASTGRASYVDVAVPDAAHAFELRVRANGPVRLFGAVLRRDVPGVVVDALGINGARVRYQLLWDEALEREQLLRRDPSLVVLAYGTNESGDFDVPIDRYEADLVAVVARIRATVPQASCLLIGPSDRPMRDRRAPLGWVDRPRTAEIIAVQRRVAASTGCGFFDFVAFMGGPLSMVAWVEHDHQYGSRDHIHLTSLGYTRLGEVLTRALLAPAPDLLERVEQVTPPPAD